MSRRGFVRSAREAEPLATGSLTFNRWPYTHPGRAGARTQHLYPFSAPDPTAFLKICAMQDCKRPLVKRSHNILWKHSSGGCLILNHTECCGRHTKKAGTPRSIHVSRCMPARANELITNHLFVAAKPKREANAQSWPQPCGIGGGLVALTNLF